MAAPPTNVSGTRTGFGQWHAAKTAAAAAFAEVAADFGDGLNRFAGLDGDFAFDQSEVVTNEIKNFAYG